MTAAVVFSWVSADGRAQATARANPTACRLNGAYRINIGDSDKLYSVVRTARSQVPFSEQQQFYMDMSVRLTPPDLIGIECDGRRISVVSSRAPKVSFLADGRTRQERSANGGVVNSRVSLEGDTLTFTTTGKAEDRINVAFQALEGGNRLRVTRRIYAEQLSTPIVIRSVYDRVGTTVNWSAFGGDLIARSGDGSSSTSPRDEAASPPPGNPNNRFTGGRNNNNNNGAAASLRRSLDEWIEATNRRDIERQMSFYTPQLKAFYLTRNTPRSAVRAEKTRAFATARSIDIRAEEPEIIFQDGGRTAIMRFHKEYQIVDRSRTRSGEVVQELRWQLINGRWHIFSERDVQVIR